MNKPSIVKNTAIITTLSCLERALGFLYRIVLARLLGAEGVGVYQIALSHSMLFQTAAGGGIPVTLSRTVSALNAVNEPKKSGGALSAALLLGALISLPITLFLFPLADKIPAFANDAPVLKILLLSLSACSAYVAIKGYFWGNKEFFAPAVFEMAEQIFTVALGVVFLSNAQGLSAVDGASRAAWAHTLACVLSLLLAIAFLIKHKPRLSSPLPFLKQTCLTAAPITAVRTGTTLVNAAIAVLLPRALVRSGLSQAAALQAFGVMTGMVAPLLFMPLTIIGSLATVLVPELAEDFQKRNRLRLQRNVERGTLFAVWVASFLAPFFMAIGKPLGALAYQNDLAGELLSRSALLLLPLSVNAILMSMLNSLGFERQTFAYSLVGSAALLLCVIFLPAVMGIYAYPVGLAVGFLIESGCSLWLLQKHCPLSARFYLRAFLCVVLTAPLGLLGQLLLQALSLFLGKWLAPIFAALLLLALALAAYRICGLLPASLHARKSTAKSSKRIPSHS